MRNIISDLVKQPISSQSGSGQLSSQSSSPLGGLASILPGGLAGGAAAGGLMALLLSNKSAKKVAKKVFKYGGTAALGGLAYKAYSNWQQNNSVDQTEANSEAGFRQNTLTQTAHASNSAGDTTLELVLIKAMIAAAKSDGDFDAKEQSKLFEAVEKLELSASEKATIFDLMRRDISVEELTASVDSDEHKAEVYLAAYLAIEVDHDQERAFLNNLSTALELPCGLAGFLEQQADHS